MQIVFSPRMFKIEEFVMLIMLLRKSSPYLLCTFEFGDKRVPSQAW